MDNLKKGSSMVRMKLLRRKRKRLNGERELDLRSMLGRRRNLGPRKGGREVDEGVRVEVLNLKRVNETEYEVMKVCIAFIAVVKDVIVLFVTCIHLHHPSILIFIIINASAVSS
jgi:hypothetical protein